MHCAPLFHYDVATEHGMVRQQHQIPLRSVSMSLVMFAGIVVMESAQARHVSASHLFAGVIPIVIAAFAYPLGNRKMMAFCGGRLDAYQRTLGMTIGSLPLWLVLSIVQFARHGLPSGGQTVQSAIVAISSGVIATVLFFTATDMTREKMHLLASVEATQAGEVVFTLFGGLIFISGTNVSFIGYVGLALVVVGMVLHSIAIQTRR